MLTTRDYEIVEFLSEFKLATTTHIKELFFPSISTARKRLKLLYKNGKVKRMRDTINKDYIYFLKEPAQLKHSLEIVNFYVALSKRYKVQSFKIEHSLKSIRPDAIFAYFDEMKRTHIGLLEVELSNKGFDIRKYEKYFISQEYKNDFPTFPEIHIISKLPLNLTSSCIYSSLRITVLQQKR